MMRQIAKFVADDGAEFETIEECAAYEALTAEVAEVVSLLRPLPKLPGCSFENGAGFIRHDPVTFRRVRRTLLQIANRIHPHDWFTKSMDDESIHPSWACRMISECCPRPLDRAWMRIYCTDKQYREWGQPFYAENPDKATQVEL